MGIHIPFFHVLESMYTHIYMYIVLFVCTVHIYTCNECNAVKMIAGYEATVFGIRYECKVKIPGDYIVHVVPPLPEVRLKLLPLGTDQCPMSPVRDGAIKLDRSKPSKLVLLDGEM